MVVVVVGGGVVGLNGEEKGETVASEKGFAALCKTSRERWVPCWMKPREEWACHLYAFRVVERRASRKDWA